MGVVFVAYATCGAGMLELGLEEKAAGGICCPTVAKVAGYSQGSLWPATFGMACCAIEIDGHRGKKKPPPPPPPALRQIARVGMEPISADAPPGPDMLIVAGNAVSQKMARCCGRFLRPDAEPKGVLARECVRVSGGHVQ